MTVIDVENPPVYSGGDFMPPSDDAFDLGSLTLAWKDVYADGAIYTDLISEFGSGVGVTIDGMLVKDSIPYADTISEKTATVGVTVDGVLLKDSGYTVYADSYFIIAGDSVTPLVAHLRKSRGTVAVPTVIVSGDLLGELSFEGYDGAAWEQAALIRVTSEGTIGSGRVPTKLSIYTNTDANPSVLTERLSISSAGLISFPTAVGPTTGLRFGGSSKNAIYGSGSELVIWTEGIPLILQSGGSYIRVDSEIQMGAFLNMQANFVQISEMTAPAAPAANKVRLYAVDNGAGKTQLMAIFPTGVAQQVAIEP